jgi:hypothetical protein
LSCDAGLAQTTQELTDDHTTHHNVPSRSNATSFGTLIVLSPIVVYLATRPTGRAGREVSASLELPPAAPRITQAGSCIVRELDSRALHTDQCGVCRAAHTLDIATHNQLQPKQNKSIPVGAFHSRQSVYQRGWTCGAGLWHIVMTECHLSQVT